MKKNFLTKNDVVRTSRKVFCCGYCRLQSLLSDSYGYNSGAYGWNWDAFRSCDGITVLTGYRNLTGQDIPDSVIDEFEEKAHKIKCNGNIAELENLKKEFFAVLENL